MLSGQRQRDLSRIIRRSGCGDMIPERFNQLPVGASGWGLFLLVPDDAGS